MKAYDLINTIDDEIPANFDVSDRVRLDADVIVKVAAFGDYALSEVYYDETNNRVVIIATEDAL